MELDNSAPSPYHTPAMKKRKPSWDELAPYAGRWVALVQGRVAGVGWTANEARWAAKRNRPKEMSEVIFVPAVEMNGDRDDDEEDRPIA